MDRFFTPLEHLPRSFPGPPAVSIVGFLPAKTDYLDRVFETFNFSFVLKGGGRYRLGDFEVEVVAPFVLTQWPGVHASYGPSGRWQSWQELYMVYRGELAGEWQRRNLAKPEKPAWSLERAGAWRDPLDALFRLLRRPNISQEADRVDRLCEQLVFESASGEARAPVSREEELVRSVQNHVKATLAEPHDFSVIARDHGLAPITFRRYWGQYVGEPPARYLTSLRIQEAQRLLLQTDRSVADIARDLGFQDPLYFSRLFRKRTGLAATDYRRHFHPSRLGSGPEVRGARAQAARDRSQG